MNLVVSHDVLQDVPPSTLKEQDVLHVVQVEQQVLQHLYLLGYQLVQQYRIQVTSVSGTMTQFATAKQPAGQGSLP